MRTSMSFAGRLSRKLIILISTLFATILLLFIASGYLSVYKMTESNCRTALDHNVVKMNKYLASQSNGEVSFDELLAEMEATKPYELALTAVISPNDSLFTADSSLAANESLVRLLIDNAKGNNHGTVQMLKSDPKAFVLYAPAANGWTTVFVCPYSVYVTSMRMSNVLFLLLALLGIILLYVICMKTITRMSQPITEFAYAAMSIGQGNFKTKIPQVNTQDEFKRFSDSLYYMEDSISGYINELKKTTAANERFESELNIASEIQMQMLPQQFPQFKEIDLNAKLKPAKEVGGDLYDFFVLGRKLYFIVGDVSGKGVPASLFMAITKASFRTVAGLDIPVNEIANKVNYTFCTCNESGMFVTLFLGYIDLDTLQMEYCNCGHNQIVVIEDDGRAEFLEAAANMAAGCFDEFHFCSETLQLNKGMRLLLYTDGVTEAENREKELYGDDRLLDFASEMAPETSSAEFVEALGKSIKDFTKDYPQSDDITIMSMLIK